MKTICIYQTNRGLGACVEPVARITVASKVSTTGKGLHALADRLQATGEEPGVCAVHQQRATDNGYLIAPESPGPAQPPTRPKQSSRRHTAAEGAKAPQGGR